MTKKPDGGQPSKEGFQTWERKLKVTGGSVKVAPELEPEVKPN